MHSKHVKFGVAMVMLLASCSPANQSSIFRTFSIEDSTSVSLDAHQRAIISSEYTVDGKPTRIIYCAEPSPDAFASITSSLSLSLDGVVLDEDKSAVLTQALAATASNALNARTATIQLLRDGLYRACEAHAAGALSRHEYAGALRQYQNMMLALLSIELLTNINQGDEVGDESSGTYDQDTLESDDEGDLTIVGLSDDSVSQITGAAKEMVDSVLSRGFENIGQTRLSECIALLMTGKAPEAVVKACERVFAEEDLIGKSSERGPDLQQLLQNTQVSPTIDDSDEGDDVMSHLGTLLSFALDDPSEIPVRTEPLEVNEEHVVKLEFSDFPKWYEFNLSEDGKYGITVSSDNEEMDPAIKLFEQSLTGSDLVEVARDDDGGFGLNSDLKIELEAGKYWLSVYELSGQGGEIKVLVEVVDD